MKIKHIDITDYIQREDYTPKSIVSNKTQSKGVEHARLIRNMYADTLRRDNEKVNQITNGKGRENRLLRLQSFKNEPLPIDKIDIKSVGRILNIRCSNSNDDKDKVVSATVMIDKKNENWLIKKYNEYENSSPTDSDSKSDDIKKPRNDQLISEIQSIRNVVLEDLWIGKPDRMPKDTREWLECWFSVNNEDDDQNKGIEQLFSCMNLEYRQTFKFNDTTVWSICANRDDLEYIMASSNDIKAFSPSVTLSGFITEENSKAQEEWAEMIQKDFKYPQEADLYLCIIDSGVNFEHPILGGIINPQDCLTVVDEWGIQDRKNHGTLMAGTAVFGDLNDYLVKQDAIRECGYRLCSVKLLSPNYGNDKKFWPLYSQQAVSLMEIHKPEKRLIFVSAVTGDNCMEKDCNSSWACALDKIAAEENGRMLLISAGNINVNDNTISAYPKSNQDTCVSTPSEAWNVLTVGAYTEKVITSENKNVVAPKFGLSPFSTTSMPWKNNKALPIKPEILMEGGNLTDEGQGQSPYRYCTNPDLEILAPSSTNIKLFDSYCGTSPAVALASRYAAIVASEHPEYWPQTIRGLFVHTADWSNQMKSDFPDIKDRLRTCGYGVPNLEKMLYSNQLGVTFISQQEISPYVKSGKSLKYNEMHIYELPWPIETLLQLGDKDVKITVTLSYFVEPMPGKFDKYNYASARLKFEMCRPNEELNQFKNRLSKSNDDEEPIEKPIVAGALKWEIGPNGRMKGSVHKDFLTTTAADLALCNKIAVYPASGWWKNKKIEGKIRYSLIVSLETQELECDILAEIENKIKIGVMPETTI